MKWLNTLTFKILICCAVLVLCLVGSIYGVIAYYQRAIVAEMEEKSDKILRAIKVQVTDMDVGVMSEEDLRQSLEYLKESHGVDAIVLYDSSKDLITSVHSPAFSRAKIGMPSDVDVIEVRPVEEAPERLAVYLQTFPLFAGDKPLGFVKIALAVAPQTHIVKAFQNRFLLVLAALFFCDVGLLCYFVLKLLGPLRELSERCTEISEGNLHAIRIRPNSSEILALETKFNEMVESLKGKAVVERQLEQSHRLSALGKLVAGIAHDIRNPLNSIKLTTSHLRDIIQGDGSQDALATRRYVDNIISEASRLDGIVENFLTLGKEKELRLEECPLDVVVSETLGLIEKEAENRKIVVRRDLKLNSQKVWIDPQQFKRALLNVLINALDATHSGGQVAVSTFGQDALAVLQVIDDGPGIGGEDLDRVFEPYFSTKEGGTGLGLSVTKTIVEQHHGTIQVDSQVGKGTTVTIHMPLPGRESSER